MSTTPQLSPLEELAQSQPQPTTPAASSSGLSPLEQLAQTSQTQSTSTVTPAQQAYRTAAGPFTVPGAAEKAMGQAIGDNKAQAKEGLTNLGKAALETGAGVVGASALTAAPEIVPEIVQKAKTMAEWAKANPIKSVAIAKIADELGVHPFDLMHSVVKYGKNLFGVSETPTNSRQVVYALCFRFSASSPKYNQRVFVSGSGKLVM
jgi:hypothetical protein